MQRKWALRSHRISSVFVFVLIGLFAVASLTLSLIGLRVYRSVTDAAGENSDAQMLLSYLSNKVRAHDTVGGISVAQLEGIPAMRFFETVEGDSYVTTVYAYQGAVWESLAQANEPFEPENGERLIAADSLAFSLLSPSLIETAVTLPGGEPRTMRVALRAGTAKEAR